jgi:two-component system nitrogen regulation sensor histidine kinase GlnL
VADRAAYAVLDRLATLVAVVDAQGCICHVNHAFEDTVGLSRRRLLGTPLAPWLLHPQLLQQTLTDGAAQSARVLRFDTVLKPLLRPPLPVHLIITAADGAGLCVVEMLPLEQQARQEREERLLEQAQANKELIRNLAHEIKNPLGGIRGAAQLLQMELQARPELAEYTQVIVHEADRLQTLVDRLLEPHRRLPVFAQINIHEVCERVRTIVLAEFPSGLSIARDYDTSIPELYADREGLVQVLLNLVRNAAQALQSRIARGDACITLRTRVQRQITIGKRRHRLALELHVIDNGPGVPDDIRERLFYPLVSGRAGGTGLGLTVAQTIVQQHQGLIECDSRPGCTDFKILLPLA